MAKMFYSLEEAAAKLKKSEGDVRQMAAKGEITEFRDGDRLIFKREQIDLLAGDDEADMSSMIPLADSSAGGPGLGLGLADSAVGREGPKERTGISVFDADELEGGADAAAQTQLDVGGGQLESVNLENFGSGSGLMELTREADDTSLGAGLMADVAAGTAAGMTGTGTSAGPGAGAMGEGGLFEGSAGTTEALMPAGVMMVAAESYDGKGSGLAAGLAIGAMLSLAFGMAVVLMGISGAMPKQILDAASPLIYLAAMAGVTLIAGIVGFVVAKK